MMIWAKIIFWTKKAFYFFIRAKNWEGVSDLSFLKTVLKDDFELNPESSA
jgi:hypothetical protein